VAALLPGRDALLALVAAGTVSRAAPLPLAVALPYAREAGLGASVERTSLLQAAVGVALALAVAVVALGVDGLVLAAVAAGAAVVVGLWARRRLGGFTGDVLGAATELAETAALVAAASVL
jgi:adenosylcobinamide-GDP ribazoletransferase